MSVRVRRGDLRYSLGLLILSVTVGLLFTLLLGAQTPAPGATKRTPPVKSTKAPAAGAGKRKQDSKKDSATKKTPTRRGPLTRQNVEDLWKNPNPELLLNEIRLRGLDFEPEEDWLASMAKLNPLPAVISELKTHIAPAPEVDAVQAQAAQLLAKVKQAVQARDDGALAEVLHPELIRAKSKVYELFDTGNYRDHTLGRFSPAEFRRVGVQFFQLTTGQVEKLDYLLFATSHGKIVLRDVRSGPEVAALYLADEAKFAQSKLELVFRAMNDGDDGALKSLCTEGLFESIQRLSGGARLTRGVYLRAAQLAAGGPVSVRMNVSMDGKSIRPVARIAFNSPTGRRIEFDVDFERMNNDLKVVRVRDTANKVIAWDPDFDNYLNRRFNLPDGPRIPEPPQGWTELLEFQPLDTIRELAVTAVRQSNPKLIREYAQEIREALPNSGEGYGLMASADHLMNKYADVLRNAKKAFENDGMVSLLAVQYRTLNAQPFWPVVMVVSPTAIRFLAVQGAPPADIPIASIKRVQIDGGGKMIIIGRKQNPFLVIEAEVGGKKRKEQFAAIGTTCTVAPEAAMKMSLVQWQGNSICISSGPPTTVRGVPIPGSGGQPAPLYVPQLWQDSLTTIQAVIESAQSGKVASR